MASVSDGHNAEGGEAAARKIVADVAEIGGLDALVALAIELAVTTAALAEEIARVQGLTALDVVDLLFLDDGAPSP